MIGPNNDKYYVYDDTYGHPITNLLKVQEKDSKDTNLSVFTYSSSGLFSVKYNTYVTIVLYPVKDGNYDGYIGFFDDHRSPGFCLQIVKKYNKRYLVASLNDGQKGTDPICSPTIKFCFGKISTQPNFTSVAVIPCNNDSINNGYPIGIDFI
jgi:hypothetical protein